MENLYPTEGARVDALLRAAPIAWFGSTRADGQPHLVPVWFLWDGETILVLTTAGSRKVGNLQGNPRATLALEGAGGGEVVIVEGEADLLAEPSAAVAGHAYFEKHADLMPAWGLTREALVAKFAQPIRLRPTRVLAW